MAASPTTILENESEVVPLFYLLRDNDEKVNWIAVVEVGESKDSVLTMRVVGHGQGGVEAFRASHLGDEAVVYVVLAVPHLEGPHAVYKHILITWVGPASTPIAKARSSVTRGRFYALADRLVVLHGELQALEAEELSDDLVAQKLVGSKLEVAVSADSGQRLHKAASGAPKPFVFSDEAAVRATIEAIRSRDSATNWVLFGYHGDEDGPLAIEAQGPGTLADILPLLKDTAVFYFVLGIQPEDEKTHGGDFTQTKHILVTWVGTAVEPLHKARSSQHRVELYQFTKKILQLHGEYQVLHPSELTEQLLKEKLTLSKVRDESDLLRAAELDRQKKAALEQKRSQPLHNFSGFQGAPTGVSSSSSSSSSFSTSSSRSSSSSSSSSTSSSSSPVPSPFRGEAEAEAIEAIKDVSSPSETNWVVFAYEANKVNLKVAARGAGGLDNFVPSHFVAGQVVYALYGLPVDEGDYSTIKYVLITWVDPEVAPLHKARSSQHRVTLYNFVNKHLQLAGEFHCLDRLINRELLLQKLAGSSIVAVGDDESARKAAQATRSSRGVSFSKGDASAAPSAAAGGGYTFEGEADIIATLKKLQNPGLDWVLFRHTQGPSKNIIGMAASGSEGASELTPLFRDDEIAYAVLVFSFVEHDDASGNYGTRKNLFISWVGSEVPPLAKARSSQHRVALERWIKTHLQLHGTLHAINQAELTPDLLKERLKK